jgi:hypothetical protein
MLYLNILDILKHKKLFFRGWMWDFRKKMTEGLNQDDILVIDKNLNKQNLKYY